MAKLIPWHMVEDLYAENFSKDSGINAINARIAFGAIFIKEYENLDDRRTVEYVMENPYAQYFLGLKEFKIEPLFDASMMVHFRKRFPSDFINRINRMIFEPEAKKVLNKKSDDRKHSKDADDKNDDNQPPPPNGSGGPEEERTIKKGTLLLDATVSPADIRYPQDLSLLNEARENTEQMIEAIWEKGDRQGHKTDYSRKKARRNYLTVAKQKRPGYAKIRKAIGQQLEYIKKNIDTLGRIFMVSGVDVLPERKLIRIMVICELYRQQQKMYEMRTHTCEDRIVSLRQPHIRPMVRGKSGRPYEFGQKISASVVGGYTFIDRQSYDSFNEGIMLKECVERYRLRYGYYPEAVLADKLYRNRENLRYCKDHGIRLSGPRLGRPKKKPTENETNQAAIDSRERNTIEGRFGNAKRRFGLDLIMSYLPETGKTEASLQVLCMNISRKMQKASTFIFLFIKRSFFWENQKFLNSVSC
jgi:hypothetical protein